jgi:hypothetical protein
MELVRSAISRALTEDKRLSIPKISREKIVKYSWLGAVDLFFGADSVFMPYGFTWVMTLICSAIQ